MKILLQTKFLIFISLFIYNCYGQKNYRFDKIVTSTFSTKNFPNQKWTNLFNSSNDKYHMKIYNRNDSLFSRIFDTKENQVHYFYIDKLDSLKLKFIKTQNWIKKVKDYKFEFSEKRKNSDEIIFKIFNNRNKKIARYKFKIKESEKNLFPIFKLSTLETLFFTDIIPSKKILILEAKGINISGNYTEYKLDSINDIDLIVQIPN